MLSSLFPPVFPCGRRGACTTGACTGHRVPRLPRSRGRACVPQSAVCARVLLLSCVLVLCCVCVCAVPAVPGTGTEISGQPSSLVQYTCGTCDLASRPPVCAVLGGDPATWHVRGPCVCCSCHLQAATSPTTCSTLHSDMLLRMPIHVLLLPASTLRPSGGDVTNDVLRRDARVWNHTDGLAQRELRVRQAPEVPVVHFDVLD